MSAFFSSRHIRELADGQKIIDGFKDRIAGNTPSFLGRDVAYDHINTPSVVRDYLRHIHICNPLKDHPQSWFSITESYRRVNARYRPEKDFSLVYWHDQNNDDYYLLMVIGPDAHNNEKWMSVLIELAEWARKKDLNLK